MTYKTAQCYTPEDRIQTGSIALMMEAANTSETSVSFHQTTRHNFPEESHLHTRGSENLKPHTLIQQLNCTWQQK
jgi:hypothetical protein